MFQQTEDTIGYLDFSQEISQISLLHNDYCVTHGLHLKDLMNVFLVFDNAMS